MDDAVERQAPDRLLPLNLFMRHLAHELGNPVASIRMSAEMLVGDFPPEMHQELFQIIMSESVRLEMLIERAVYFSAIGVPTRIETELAGLVESAVKQGEITIPVELHGASSGEIIQVDASQFARLFREILQNAMQSGASRADVTLRNEGALREITIVDDGQGIARDKFPAVMTPFYSSRDGQLGVGLNIVQRILDLHHGSIEIAGAEPKGTTVTIRFPQSI